MDGVGVKNEGPQAISVCKESDTNAIASQITLLTTTNNSEPMKNDFVTDKMDTVSTAGLINSGPEAGVLLDTSRGQVSFM